MIGDQRRCQVENRGALIRSGNKDALLDEITAPNGTLRYAEIICR